MDAAQTEVHSIGMTSIVPNADKGRAGSLKKRASRAKTHAESIYAAALAIAEMLPSEDVTLTVITNLLNKSGYKSSREKPLTSTMLKRLLKRCGGSIDDIKWLIWHDELYEIVNRDHLEPDFTDDNPDFQRILDSTSDGSLMGKRNQNRSNKILRKLNTEPENSIISLGHKLNTTIEEIWEYDEGLPDGRDPEKIDSLVSEYLDAHRKQMKLRKNL